MNMPLHNMPLHSTTSHRDEAAGPDTISHATTDDMISARFAALVHVICPDAPPVDAGCMRRMAAMLADGDWQCCEREALERLLNASRQTGSFDPGLHDIVWSRLSHEDQAYADFLRLRQREAEYRHQAVGAFAFDRHDWERAHEAELALRDHQRHVREASYAPGASVDVFRVH